MGRGCKVSCTWVRGAPGDGGAGCSVGGNTPKVAGFVVEDAVCGLYFSLSSLIFYFTSGVPTYHKPGASVAVRTGVGDAIACTSGPFRMHCARLLHERNGRARALSQRPRWQAPPFNSSCPNRTSRGRSAFSSSQLASISRLVAPVASIANLIRSSGKPIAVSVPISSSLVSWDGGMEKG